MFNKNRQNDNIFYSLRNKMSHGPLSIIDFPATTGSLYRGYITNIEVFPF